MRFKVLAVLMFAACNSAKAQPAGAPDWMTGYWLSCERGVQTAESWIGADATLVGVNVSGGKHGGYEFLRIGPNASGGVSYYSMPEGRSPPTEFRMVGNADRRAVFENPAHDFPQRIIYERHGAVMRARIEDMGATQGMEWTFRRASFNSRCRIP